MVSVVRLGWCAEWQYRPITCIWSISVTNSIVVFTHPYTNRVRRRTNDSTDDAQSITGDESKNCTLGINKLVSEPDGDRFKNNCEPPNEIRERRGQHKRHLTSINVEIPWSPTWEWLTHVGSLLSSWFYDKLWFIRLEARRRMPVTAATTALNFSETYCIFHIAYRILYIAYFWLIWLSSAGSISCVIVHRFGNEVAKNAQAMSEPEPNFLSDSS